MPPSRMTDVLILAAHPPELAGLAALLGGSLHATVSGVAVVAEAVGIGLPAAAAGAARAIHTHEPRCVVLVGTCGIYAGRGGDLAVGGVVRARRILLASTAAVDGHGAFPAPMNVAIESDAELSGAI